MAHDLKAIDALIGRLGGLISAKRDMGVSPIEQVAIKTAVAEAASAVARATKAEGHGLEFAHSQVDMAEEVIATLDHPLAEMRRFRAAALPLCERARTLIEQARGLQAQALALTGGIEKS
jgi:hypothetical protein